MTETEFADAVAAIAHTFGWHIAHFRPARTAHGWRTPVAYDGKGWPDLVLVHDDPPTVLFRELKAERGRLTDEQLRWGAWLESAGADWAVWYPRDLSTITTILSHGKATAL